MKKSSKRKKQLDYLIQQNNNKYSIDHAIHLLKQTATAKFIESVEIHINLNIKPKYSDQQLRASLILPNKIIKKKKIAVIVPNEKILPEYYELADIFDSENLIELIKKKNLDLDLLLTTPDMMIKLMKFNKILSSKGLMPSIKTGTITKDIITSLHEFRRGKILYRADKFGVVHLLFGKTNFTNEELSQNLHVIYQSIQQNKPSSLKGQYFKSINLCTTMGPAINIDLSSFKNNKI